MAAALEEIGIKVGRLIFLLKAVVNFMFFQAETLPSRIEQAKAEAAISLQDTTESADDLYTKLKVSHVYRLSSCHFSLIIRN